MRALIVSPEPLDSTRGNSITAVRWAGILRKLGHNVSVASDWTRSSGKDFELLIALHARRSHSSIAAFPGPVVLGLTGTDLYGDLPGNAEARDSVSMATRIVVLQGAALQELDESARAKTRVIYQSSVATAGKHPQDNCFDVCVLAHLRDVKDPLRAAAASRQLPVSSKIRVIHAGRAMDATWEEAARSEERTNPRYHWLGELSHEGAAELLASSRLLVLSSKMEGGANAISEAVVCDVPALCSDIPGNVGMLASDYPGFFPVGDAGKLAELLNRAETDPGFLGSLDQFIRKLQPRFTPEREIAAWESLIAEL